MITAKGDMQDAVELNAGADDRVTKPFAVEELLARVNAVLRERNMILSTFLGPNKIRESYIDMAETCLYQR